MQPNTFECSITSWIEDIRRIVTREGEQALGKDAFDKEDKFLGAGV